MVFTHGGTFHDGGWFDTSKGKPQVQVQAVKDGPWTTVGELADYPATTATDNKSIKNNTRFACTLATPVKALSVRVIGRPACGDVPARSMSSSAGLAAYTAPSPVGSCPATVACNCARKPTQAAESPLKALETKLKMAHEYVPGPGQ